MGQLVGIQFARALAAIAVMFGHVGAEFGPLGLPSPFPAFNEGAAGVDLFFVVSGFVIALSSEKLIGRGAAPVVFIARRIARIVPLWWLCTGAMLVAYLSIYTGLAVADLSARNVISSLFFYPTPRPGGGYYPVIPQGWTLYYEMMFYGLFAIALIASRSLIIVVAITGAIILAIASLFYLGIPAVQPLRYWANPIIIEFIFGMAICLLYQRGWRMPVSVACALTVLGLVLLFRPGSVNGGWVTLGREFEWGLPAAAIVAGLALGHWQEAPAFIAKPVVLLGDASYALYLTHAMIFWLVRAKLANAIDATAHPYVFVVILLSTAIAASIAIFLLFERPTTRILQGCIELWRTSPDFSKEWRRLSYGAITIAIGWAAISTMPTFESRAARLQRSAQSEPDQAKAIVRYGEAIAITPNNPALYFLRGSALLANKKPQQAAEDFVAGLKLDPGNVTLKYLLEQATQQGAIVNVADR